MPIHTLNIDLETRSGADIGKTGVYRYAEDPDFDILLFAVSINRGPVTVYDLTGGESLPPEILDAMTDSAVTKWAYNASFERVCLSEWLRKKHPERLRRQYLDPAGWRYSMVWAATLGLPMGLEKVGAVLHLERQKMKEGKDLIRWFCSPCRPTKTNGGRKWNLPCHAPEKWELFKAYNKRDVEAEMQIQERLQHYPVPDEIWEQYALDQEINDRGIRIDRKLVQSALRIDAITKSDLTQKLTEKTGLDNPNSVVQMKEYLNLSGLKTETLSKKEVREMLGTAPENLKEILNLRLQLAKSSVRKYEAMQNAVCKDGRCRGMFQFYGAVRSGRWAGRLIQLQNLPQNHMKDLDAARELTKNLDYEMLNMLYDSVPQVLSELIRTAFIPEDGKKFIVADFSAIEARVLSCLAGETWRSEVFKNGGDIYCASAEKMFHVPVEKHGRNGDLRQKGKIAELALGYGGSVGALKSMDTDKKLKEEELRPIVNAWRDASPHIVRFWWTVDEAVKNAIRKREPQTIRIPDTGAQITIRCTGGMLFITLPSGRRLSYVRPWIEPNTYGGESVTYMGTDIAKKWTRIESYGPKFVENIVQAISRDILAEAMENLAEAGFRIVGHVHDEVIVETDESTPVQEICNIMQKTPGWLRGSKPTVSPAGCPAQPEGRRVSPAARGARAGTPAAVRVRFLAKQAESPLQGLSAPTEIADICLRADGYECGYYMKS